MFWTKKQHFAVIILSSICFAGRAHTAGTLSIRDTSGAKNTESGKNLEGELISIPNPAKFCSRLAKIITTDCKDAVLALSTGEVSKDNIKCSVESVGCVATVKHCQVAVSCDGSQGTTLSKSGIVGSLIQLAIDCVKKKEAPTLTIGVCVVTLSRVD